MCVCVHARVSGRDKGRVRGEGGKVVAVCACMHAGCKELLPVIKHLIELKKVQHMQMTML